MPNTKYYVSKEKLGLYDEKIKKYMSDADAAVLAEAKAHAEGLDDLYDTAGLAATAESNAKAYTDAQVATAQAAADAAQGAADAAQGAADAAQSTADGAASEVANLKTYVGTIPTTEAYEDIEDVIGYIDKKAIETLAAASGNSTETAASVKQQLDTYVASNDTKIEEIEGLVETAQGAADDALAHSQGVAEDLAEAIEALEGADADQVERILALEGQITGLSGAMHFKGIITGDKLPETTEGYENGDVVIFGNKEYVVNNGAFVEFGDVDAQAEAITELTGRADGVDDKIEEIEGDISGLETEIGNKVAQEDYNAKIEALEGADSGLDERLAVVEDMLDGGEGSIAAQIETAKNAAITAAGTEADNKDTALKNAITTEYKAYVDEADKEITDRLALVENDKHTHANKSLLDTYTQTEANLADAVIKKHEHANADVINAIEAANITTWNSVTSKASQTDLDLATGRIDTLEAWHDAFAECSEDDINNLFKVNA